MCLYTKLIKNPKYKSNKKNKGIVPDVKDERVLWVPVGCGKCIECRNQKKRNWQIRLHEEIKSDNTGKFVTLTFRNDSLESLSKELNLSENNAIATIAVRRFLERWRKEFKKSVKHWLITEMGHENTERIHLHGIIFTDKDVKNIEKHWQYGNVFIGQYVNERTINYIVKYVTKIDLDHKGFEGVILTSAGIGNGYLKKTGAVDNRYKREKTNENYRLPNGFKVNLPIYYRNKIYTEEERENLWLNKIEKGEIYIRGIKYECKTEEQIAHIEEVRKEAQRVVK